MAVLLIYVGLLGLMIGSFANVVIYRLPRRQSLVLPASQCPVCGHPIRRRHNIPVAGWCMLRGNCADCGARISVRYPLVELGTALIFVGITLRLDAVDLLPALPAYLYFGAAGLVLALVQIDAQALPTPLVISSYAVILMLLAAASAWQHEWSNLARGVVGMLALAGLCWATSLVLPTAISREDARVAGLAGLVLAYLSWGALAVGAATGLLVWSAIAIAIRARARGSESPTPLFGAALLAASLAAILVGWGSAP